MKIFMLCNVEIPLITEAEGRKGNVFGGWLDNISRFLSQENELTICYMNNKNTHLHDNRNTYVGFIESQAEEVLSKVLQKKTFDIYHIWGTEYLHSYVCVSILEKLRALDRCIVSIQGLVSVYAKHYTEGLPGKTMHRSTPKEWLLGNTIKRGTDSFLSRGEAEIKLLKKVKHVIGRTTWDKACLWTINPDAIYHKCNENLRDCFYDDSACWDISKVKRHTIFVSQCSYPVKGFHYLLEAMPLILKKYPDARIITTGDNFLKLDGINRIIKLDSYKRYLTELVKRHNLYSKLVFKGTLTSEQMKAEYLRANVFVCCSTIENSPNSVGEAMVSGCPVVASYVGGTMDMLQKDSEGYLYQTSSAEMLAYYINRVFDDHEKTVEISKNARRRALTTHDRKTNNNVMLSIYQEIEATAHHTH